ncbi:hypothetical protein BCR42DRAFT_401659 [Absidia repens]|uniref:Uncharacterized protein n=1 Tax=Absidia repens TaxID=90262 RepID=A0A1X2J2T1_9FUNG|nr:hypothetical protein BCR42DRAFT_401659 [Absidia repens]
MNGAFFDQNSPHHLSELDLVVFPFIFIFMFLSGYKEYKLLLLLSQFPWANFIFALPKNVASGKARARPFFVPRKPR